MKKLLCLIGSIAFIFLILSIGMKVMVVDKFSNAFLKEKVSNMVISSIKDNISEVDSYTLTEIENKIKNNKSFNEITDLYFNNLINDLENNTVTEEGVNEKIRTIVISNLNDIPSNYQRPIIDKVNSIDFNRIYRNILGYLKEEVVKENTGYIKVFKTLTSLKYKIYAGLIIVLANVLLYLLVKEKIELIQIYGINFMILGGIFVVISLLFRQILTFLASSMIGSNVSVSASFITVTGLVLFGLGYILLDIYDRKKAKK